MRLKLLIENFRHHWVLSVFIALICIFISSFSLITIEFNDYLLHLGLHRNLYDSHNFDITISSPTPLSLIGIDGYYENDNYYSLDDYYQRKATFYSSTLIVEGNGNQIVSGILEGDEEDYLTAFDLITIPNDNEVVITKELSDELGLDIDDFLSVYIGDTKYQYKIIDVIASKGKYSGVTALLGGRHLTYYYGFNNVKMQNLIMLDLKDNDKAEEVCDLLKNNYGNYNIINVLDKEKAEGFSANTLSPMIGMAIAVFMIILLSLINIYSYRISKQREFFKYNGILSYYSQVNIIFWVILFIISLIFGALFTHLIFEVFYNIFYCNVNYKINIQNYLFAPLFIFVVPILKYLLNNFKIKTFNSNIIYFSLLIISFLLLFIIKDKIYFSLIIILFTVLLMMGIINLVMVLVKYIKPFLPRVYLYNINKGNRITKLLVFVQILIYTILVILFTNIVTYNNHIDEFDEMFKLDDLLVTNTYVELNDNTDVIKIANNITLDDMDLLFMLALDGNQLYEYSNIYLSETEIKEYNSGKYIILSKHYHDVNKFNIGDEIVLNIYGVEETFKIYKFLDTSFVKMAFVSDSEAMSFGYVLQNDINADFITSKFLGVKYRLIDVQLSVNFMKNQFRNVIAVITSIVFILIAITILYSMYLFYLDYQYQEKNVKIFKVLGCSNENWFKLVCYKAMLTSLICIVLGFVFNLIVITNIESIFIFLNSVTYIKFNINIALVFLLVIILNNIVGIYYSNYMYKRIKL